jgi:hypothetical protein
MQRQQGGKAAQRIRTDNLYDGPAAIDLMMILVQDSGNQLVAGLQLRAGACADRAERRAAARTAGGRYLCLSLESLL